MARRQAPGFDSLITRSDAMRSAIERGRRAAQLEVPVVIQGEKGTGKLLFARALHAASRRAQGPFIELECESVASERLDERLLGRAGARGGGGATKGAAERASGGTLCLGSAGHLSRDAQAALLHLLESGEIQPLGARAPRRVDPRLVVLTHHNLVDDARTGRFNHELYYRLAVAVIRIPPLRARLEDLDLLVEYFLERLRAETGSAPAQLTAAARKLLREQPWHGNVRELQNALRRTLLWREGERITPGDLREALDDAESPHRSDVMHRPLGDSFRIDEVLAEVESHYIRLALDHTGGNKARAAGLLGLNSSTTLSNRMEKRGVA